MLRPHRFGKDGHGQVEDAGASNALEGAKDDAAYSRQSDAGTDKNENGVLEYGANYVQLCHGLRSSAGGGEGNEQQIGQYKKQPPAKSMARLDPDYQKSCNAVRQSHGLKRQFV